MKKVLDKKGFTLMEMMIVIAIIVILIAVSIPTLSGSMEKANKATDASNLRAAKAVYLAQKMDGEFIIENGKNYYYDFNEGKFKEGNTDQATAADSLGSCANHAGAYIRVRVVNGVLTEPEWRNGAVDCDTAPVPDYD